MIVKSNGSFAAVVSTVIPASLAISDPCSASDKKILHPSSLAFFDLPEK